MPRIKLTLEYDGTAYVGWQAQPNGVSIQERVTSALRALLGEEVALLAAGRTDSGVHAMGQVASFRTARSLPLKAYTSGLNGFLPRDIAVVEAEEVSEGFDPRRHATGKHYRYRIWNGRQRSPLRGRTHWEIFSELSVEAMRAAALPLVGRHDFSAFRAANCQAHHAVREVVRLEVGGDPRGEISIDVEGTAFLKHMVRNLVGTLVEVARGRRPAAWVADVLASRDRTRAGQTAPAHGLTLVRVYYG